MSYYDYDDSLATIYSWRTTLLVLQLYKHTLTYHSIFQDHFENGSESLGGSKVSRRFFTDGLEGDRLWCNEKKEA